MFGVQLEDRQWSHGSFRLWEDSRGHCVSPCLLWCTCALRQLGSCVSMFLELPHALSFLGVLLCGGGGGMEEASRM